MICCCTQTKNLGCVNSCGATIETGIVATLSGEHTLWIESAISKTKLTEIFESGAALNFEIDGLRDQTLYTFSISDPDDEFLSDADGNDCFTIKTEMAWSPQLVAEEVGGIDTGE